MSLVFDEQWSALQKPNREEIPDELFEVFENAADTQMENWGFVNSLLKIMEAAFVAGFFNYTNRWANTCMAMPNPAHYSHNR